MTAETLTAVASPPSTSKVALPSRTGSPPTARVVDRLVPLAEASFSVSVHEPVGTSPTCAVSPALTITCLGEPALPVTLSVQVYSKVNSAGASCAPSPSTVLDTEKPPVCRV